MLNIGIIIVSPLPSSLPFYTTIAFKSYIPLTFSERMFLLPCIYNGEAHFLGSNPEEVDFFSFGFFFFPYPGVQFYRKMLFVLCYERTFVVFFKSFVLISLLGTGNHI